MGDIAPFADHGERYTIFDNDILDYVMPACKTGAQWKIVCAILRATRGWHKERDVLSLSQLEARTGMTRPAVMAGIEAALKAGMIVREESGKSFSYSLNRDFTIGKESLPSDSKESLPVIGKESLHTKETSKEKKETPRTKRAGRTYSEHTNEIVKAYYSLLSKDERKLESYPKLLSIASKAGEEISAAALEAEYRAMRADAFYTDKTPGLLAILKRLAAKRATATTAAPSGARAGVRVVGQAHTGKEG